jgi:hypothetical protein
MVPPRNLRGALAAIERGKKSRARLRIAGNESPGAVMMAVFATQPERLPMNPTGVRNSVIRAGAGERRSDFMLR